MAYPEYTTYYHVLQSLSNEELVSLSQEKLLDLTTRVKNEVSEILTKHPYRDISNDDYKYNTIFQQLLPRGITEISAIDALYKLSSSEREGLKTVLLEILRDTDGDGEGIYRYNHIMCLAAGRAVWSEEDWRAMQANFDKNKDTRNLTKTDEKLIQEEIRRHGNDIDIILCVDNGSLRSPKELIEDINALLHKYKHKIISFSKEADREIGTSYMFVPEKYRQGDIGVLKHKTVDQDTPNFIIQTENSRNIHISIKRNGIHGILGKLQEEFFMWGPMSLLFGARGLGNRDLRELIDGVNNGKIQNTTKTLEQKIAEVETYQKELFSQQQKKERPWNPETDDLPF